MKRKDIWLLITIIFLSFFTFSGSAYPVDGNFLIKYILPDKAGKLLFLGGKKENEKVEIKYNVTRLSDPHRMVVDIENAILQEGKKSVVLNNEKLKEEIRLAQFSKDPDVVRIVFTAKSSDILDKIKISVYKNNVGFEIEDIELAKIPVSSVYKDRNIPQDEKSNKYNEIKVEKKPEEKIQKTDSSGQLKLAEKTVNNPEPMKEAQEAVVEIKKDNVAKETSGEEKNEIEEKQAILDEIKKKVKHNIIINNALSQENRVLISGAGIISLAEPFVLESPTRKIFDITEAALDSAGLIKEINLKNGDIVRIAQFDPKTVRIVVETESPDNYTNAFSPDLQSIIISTRNELSFAEFPDNTATGEIKDIKVIKNDDNKTKLVLTSKKPIIHNIDRLYSPDRLDLSLFNIKQPEEEIFKNLEKTGQFHGFEIKPIDKITDGSKWELSLNRSTIIKTKLSLDGRVLEITLEDSVAAVPAGGDKVKNKIVIDPGHGGYDPGAQKNGIFEKDIALDVSKRVKKHLEDAGFYVILTREQDKTVSLKDRVDLTNKENPDLFLSIHVNASRNPEIRGVETHWYTLKSRPLAMQVQDQMVNRVVIPDRGLKNSRFYVIRNSKVPAVLAEIGYMSNEIEFYQLLTEERKEASARAIAEGIINYIKAKKSGSDTSGRNKL